MKTRIIQKAILLNGSNQMLMVRRSKTDVRRPLQWDLPGGVLEDGEELIDGVKREIVEETALEVDDLKLVYSKTEIRKWLSKELGHEKKFTENVIFIFYIARTKSEKVKLSYEHDKYQWRTLDQAAQEFEYYLHKELVQHVLTNNLA